jgi:hypothetical protein
VVAPGVVAGAPVDPAPPPPHPPARTASATTITITSERAAMGWMRPET